MTRRLTRAPHRQTEAADILCHPDINLNSFDRQIRKSSPQLLHTHRDTAHLHNTAGEDPLNVYNPHSDPHLTSRPSPPQPGAGRLLGGALSQEALPPLAMVPQIAPRFSWAHAWRRLLHPRTFLAPKGRVAELEADTSNAEGEKKTRRQRPRRSRFLLFTSVPRVKIAAKKEKRNAPPKLEPPKLEPPELEPPDALVELLEPLIARQTEDLTAGELFNDARFTELRSNDPQCIAVHHNATRPINIPRLVDNSGLTDNSGLSGVTGAPRIFDERVKIPTEAWAGLSTHGFFSRQRDYKSLVEATLERAYEQLEKNPLREKMTFACESDGATMSDCLEDPPMEGPWISRLIESEWCPNLAVDVAARFFGGERTAQAVRTRRVCRIADLTRLPDERKLQLYRQLTGRKVSPPESSWDDSMGLYNSADMGLDVEELRGLAEREFRSLCVHLWSGKRFVMLLPDFSHAPMYCNLSGDLATLGVKHTPDVSTLFPVADILNSTVFWLRPKLCAALVLEFRDRRLVYLFPTIAEADKWEAVFRLLALLEVCSFYVHSLLSALPHFYSLTLTLLHAHTLAWTHSCMHTLACTHLACTLFSCTRFLHCHSCPSQMLAW